MALKVLKELKRKPLFRKVDTCVTSLTGDKITFVGEIEFTLDTIGLVTFLVVKQMSHEIILGIDELGKHAYYLNNDFLIWGQDVFPLIDTARSLGSEVVSLDICHDHLQSVLLKYKHLFKEGNLPTAKLPAIEVTTESGKIVHKKPYRLPLTKRVIAEDEIQKMLTNGIIRPSNSEWASPITLVPKQDGTTRFCVDYRAVNDVTIKDRYPLPLIQDIFDTLNGSVIYSSIDLQSGYWQLPVHPDSVKKAAFVCHLGQYEFLRMPFGLCNAPAVFQRAMNQILAPFIGKFAMVYLDDVIIFSKTPEEHAQHLDQVLKTFAGAGLTLKESKCHFGKSTLNLLGYEISKAGISAQPAKTRAIAELSAPRNVSELRSFLGMASYYRQLVEGFAKIAQPLYRLTSKSVSWTWGSAENQAFTNLKNALVSSTVMAYPNTSQPYILYTDASEFAIGAILCQEDDEGVERPIQYLSQQLTPTQRKYAVIEKEAFAVVYALKKLRPYLLGSDCTVYTDHKPLLSFFVGEVANTKIQRWAILLAEFGARIRYRPGKNNIRADMLSRIKFQKEAAVLDADSEWVSPDQVKAHLPPNVPVLADNIDVDALLFDQRNEFSDEREACSDPSSRLILIDDLVYSIARPRHNVPQYPRLLLPSRYRDQVISRCHEDIGHQSLYKTMARVQESYVWPAMKREISNWINKCALCAVHTKRREKVPLGEMPIATASGLYVGIDLIGPLTPSRYSGARYIMTCIDYYDGWTEAYPLQRKTNEAVWERLRNDFVPRHSAPEVIITDQGSEFKGIDFAQWLQGMGIEHRKTTPYHPQSNGRVERFNGTLKRILKKMINGERADWEDRLGTALAAYRISTSVVTGHSPFMLRYAHPPRFPLTRLLGDDPSRNFNNRLELQADLMQAAAKATEDSRVHNRARLARQANAGVINVGDKVMLKAREPLSMTAQWDYGFLVSRINGKAITLLHPTTGVRQTVNRDQVRVVDPDIAWDQVHPRPRRTQARVRDREQIAPRERLVADQHSPPPSPPPEDAIQPVPFAQDDQMDTDEFPRNGEHVPDPVRHPPLPRLRLKRQVPDNEPEEPEATTSGYNLRKRPRWTAEEIAVINNFLQWLAVPPSSFS